MMTDDNERTVMRSPRMPSSPSSDSASEYNVNVLPVGTRLGEFEIVDLIGEGGFGIVYLAYDHSLERHVALKEYMPSGLAMRTTRMAVTVRSQHNADTFTAGLKSFVNEARMLAQFDSPALVKVHRFWEGNGTAYMVMPFYDGITLKQALKERRILPTEPWIRLLLGDLFDAIDTIHRVQCFHRDIAPDNILLLKDGRPLLLDFGAARRVIGDLTQCLTVILKPGFAPIEQYADIAGLRQGAWTDIYALAAVVYYLIVGKAPPPAVARFIHDDMVPACEAGKERYSNAFLSVVDKALAVKPEQRFQSIAELRHALNIMDAVPRTLPRPITPRSPARGVPTVPMPEAKPTAKPDRQKPSNQSAPRPDSDWNKTWRMDKSAWIVLALLLSVGIAIGAYWGTNLWWTESPEQPVVAGGSAPAPDSSGSSEAPDQAPTEQPAAPPETPPTPPVAQAPPVLPPAENMTSTAPRTNDAASPKPDRAQSTPPALPPASEDELWQSASASDKASAYKNYLRRYPKGRYATAAKRRLLMREQPKAAVITQPGISPPPPPQEAKPRATPDTAPKTAAPSAEEELWTKAASSNEAPAYEAYLDKYPNGLHAPAAKDKLASIKPTEPAAVPSPPPVVVQPQAPETVPAERNAPAEADRQASIKPLEPSVPSVPEQVAPEPTPTPTPTPAPEPPVATGKKSLTLDGQTLTGDFSVDPETGIVSGTGKIVWADGTQFEGTLVRGMKEGKGRFRWSNGQRYNGDWARDLPNGKGTIIFPNGDRYTGDVTDGMPHGQGTTRFKGGDVYSGAWVRGKSQGYGRYTWVNGSYWEGEFKDDKRTENGKIVFAEGASETTTSTPPAAMGEARDAERPAADKGSLDK